MQLIWSGLNALFDRAEDDKAESLYYYLARSLGALSRVAVTTVEETKKSTPPSAQAAETAKQGSLSPAATVFVEAVVASLSLVASFSNYHQGESPLCGVPSRALEVAKILVRKFETAHLEATILAAIAGLKTRCFMRGEWVLSEFLGDMNSRFPSRGIGSNSMSTNVDARGELEKRRKKTIELLSSLNVWISPSLLLISDSSGYSRGSSACIRFSCFTNKRFLDIKE